MALVFRGVDDLYIAKVTSDDSTGIVYETPVQLAHVATVSRTSDQSEATYYYDNTPMVVIQAQGSDTVTITCTIPERELLAEITGNFYDSTTGMMVEGIRNTPYYALGYRFQYEDGNEQYVWRLKGKFQMPDETSNTMDDSTDITQTELTYTGISTIAQFDKNNGPSIAVTADTQTGLMDFTNWFDAVVTPDTATPKTVPTAGTLSAVAGSTSPDVDITWTAPTNLGSLTVTNYSLTATVSGGTATQVYTGTNLTYTDSSQTASTSVTYNLTATLSDGSTLNYAPSTVTVP